MKRFLNNKRGQIRVIEAFFASVLMLSSLALIPAIQDRSTNSDNVLASKAFNVLISLDSDGQLARFIDQRNWSAIKNLIQSCISPTLWFNITVLDENQLVLNDRLVCSGSAIGNHIEIAEYICTSTNSTFAIYIVRLQLGGLN